MRAFTGRITELQSDFNHQKINWSNGRIDSVASLYQSSFCKPLLELFTYDKRGHIQTRTSYSLKPGAEAIRDRMVYRKNARPGEENPGSRESPWLAAGTTCAEKYDLVPLDAVWRIDISLRSSLNKEETGGSILQAFCNACSNYFISFGMLRHSGGGAGYKIKARHSFD